MTIHYRQQGSAIIILGNTYAFRDQLKALGARFNGSDRHWRAPLTPANLATVADLCAQAGGGSLGTAAATSLGLPQASQVPAALTEGASVARFEPPEDSASFTIRQLMERVDQAVSRAFPESVWVTGEVQNCSRKGSGLYFDLAEARSGSHANATVTVRAIIWSGTLASMQTRRGADKIAEVLQDGMQVRCLCQVQLYKDRGSITLLVSDIDPAYTKGALALARERLLKELRAKGLDQANKNLPLPAFPLRVGLISAEGSRAKADFLDQLVSLNYPGVVVFCPATMQGEQVPQQVVRALALLMAADCDLVVITRGGGSAADLRWFDASEIAYAIAAARVPVIAAIGHHEDVCVAEEICHRRQKTPTAAADFVVSICADTRARIDALAAAMAKTLAQRLNALAVLTAALIGRLHAAAERAMEGRQATLTQAGHALQRGVVTHLHSSLNRLREAAGLLNLGGERRLGAAATKLAELLGRLQQRDPSSWLKQGWTRLSGKAGAVTSVQQVQTGEALRARLSDGWLELTVTAQTPKPPETTHE